jgi:hypothetical protein
VPQANVAWSYWNHSFHACFNSTPDQNTFAFVSFAHLSRLQSISIHVNCVARLCSADEDIKLMLVAGMLIFHAPPA